jgi:two-component system phosphate regulon sensor histidine kinase PhoR
VGGTGLGLSIVKHLVQAMKGSVRAASRVGQGTTFIVCLPRAVSS